MCSRVQLECEAAVRRLDLGQRGSRLEAEHVVRAALEEGRRRRAAVMRARRTLYVPPKLDALRAWCEQQDTAPSFAASLRLAVTQCVWRGEGVQRERSSGGMTSYSRCLLQRCRAPLARLCYLSKQAKEFALASRLHCRRRAVGLSLETRIARRRPMARSSRARRLRKAPGVIEQG